MSFLSRSFHCALAPLLLLAALLAPLPLAAWPATAPPGESVVQNAGVVPAQAASCDACDVAQERCSANCLGLEGKVESATCLIRCDNAADLCSGDEEVTLRSEDLVAHADWLDAAPAACHSSATHCGSAYPACASWSGYSDCDDSYCAPTRGCGDPCADPRFCFGPALRQDRERFRVCFNELGQSCTEYQTTWVFLSCGC